VYILYGNRELLQAGTVHPAPSGTIKGTAMSLVEQVKKVAEKATGWNRPAKKNLASLVLLKTEHTFRFKDDGVIPNHPRWPVIIYRSVCRLPEDLDPASVFEEVFEANGWGDSWRDGIYDYLHYHSRIHEVLGIARGTGKVQLGGPEGLAFDLNAGDVAILPAGTGHQCLSASEDFLVVGAYPPGGTYDECRGSLEERERALASIPRVGRPRRDPVFGPMGPLVKIWIPEGN
jgi:uncharacterized protein YjlB